MGDENAGQRDVVELPRLERAEFDYYLGWAHRLGMIDHWEVFESELHAAVTVALGLHEIPADLDDAQAVWVGEVHRRLSLQLLEAQAAYDPTTRWPDFLERLWSECRQLAFDLPAGSGGLAALLERDPPALDDHAEPGVPLRLLPWLERLQFQRSVTDAYLEQPPDAWPLFRDALSRALSADFGLTSSRTDQSSSCEDTRIDGQLRRLGQLLDYARERFDPAVRRQEFREIVWAGRHLGSAVTR